MRESKERAAGQINHNQFQRHTKSLILIELAAERNSLLHSFRKFISFSWAALILSLFSLNFFRFFKKWRKEEKAKDIQFDWFGCFLLFAEHYGGEPPITHHKGNQPIKPNFIPTYAAKLSALNSTHNLSSHSQREERWS
jgi:hypothetical protein